MALIKQTSTFTPNLIPGLIVDLDTTATGSVIQVANLVSQVSNLIVPTNNFAQAIDLNKPTYQPTAGPKGEPVILFDGVNDQLTAQNNLLLPSGMSVFAVVNLVSAGPVRAPLFCCQEWMCQIYGFSTKFEFLGSSGDVAGPLSMLGAGFKAIGFTNIIRAATLRTSNLLSSGITNVASARGTTSIGRDPATPTRVANMQLRRLLVYNQPLADSLQLFILNYLQNLII